SFFFGGSTGGVGIGARFIIKFLGYSMRRTMFVVDFTVIALSLLTFLYLVQGMYTLVAVYLGARVIDFIQDCAYTARGATIISAHYQAIAEKINLKMDRGVTLLPGKGHYSGADHKVLYCVVGKNEIRSEEHT